MHVPLTSVFCSSFAYDHSRLAQPQLNKLAASRGRVERLKDTYQITMASRGRSRSRPAKMEFSIDQVGEAVSCAPTFRAKADSWQADPATVPERDIRLEDIKKRLERAQLKRKVREAQTALPTAAHARLRKRCLHFAMQTNQMSML